MSRKPRAYKGGYRSKQSRVLMTDGGLSKFLKSLPKEMTAEVRPAIKEWAREISASAKSMAPVADVPIERGKNRKETQPGTLRDAIRFSLFNRGFSAVAGIYGKKGKAAWYANFVERGTKPHYNVKGGATKGKKVSLFLVAAAKHPGAKAQPFLTPAAKQAGPSGARKVVAAIQSVLKKAAAAGLGGGQLVEAERALQKMTSAAAELRTSELAAPVFSGGIAEE